MNKILIIVIIVGIIIVLGLVFGLSSSSSSKNPEEKPIVDPPVVTPPVVNPPVVPPSTVPCGQTELKALTIWGKTWSSIGGTYALDTINKKVTLTLPAGVTFVVTGTASDPKVADVTGIFSSNIPDCIMPKTNISAGLDKTIIDFPTLNTTPPTGMGYLRLYPVPGGKTRFIIHYSGLGGSNWYNWPVGTVKLLKPITATWIYA
jgi:hypothetical protein